jgi:hypothetical protein
MRVPERFRVGTFAPADHLVHASGRTTGAGKAIGPKLLDGEVQAKVTERQAPPASIAGMEPFRYRVLTRILRAFDRVSPERSVRWPHGKEP